MIYEHTYDEYDIVVFEDDKLKFFKENEEEEEDFYEPEDEYVTRRYDAIHSVFDMLSEHFIYSGVGYFDRLYMTELNDYFHDVNCDISHGLEINQEIPEFEKITYKIKKPTIYEWIGMRYDKLKLSYEYMKRLSKSHGLPVGSFETFCALGYETSSK